MSQAKAPDDSERENSSFLGTAKAQESKGSMSATIPADAAEELDLEKGDRLVYRAGKEGEIVVGKASDIF